jgi:hypothetical protein
MDATGHSDPLHLVDDIYDATLDASRWRGLVERLADYLGARTRPRRK